MKHTTLVAALAALALLTAPARALDAVFRDVPEDAWYAEAADWCRETGLLRGVREGVFSPEAPATRAMAVTALHRLAGEPEAKGAAPFSDVPPWCAGAAAWAAERGIVTGYADGTFRPGDPVTRQQLCVFLWRYEGAPPAENMEDGFADRSSIAEYARVAAAWCYEAGLLRGYPDGSLRPEETASRAHLAALLKNYAEAERADGIRYTDLDPSCAPVGIAAAEDGALLVTDRHYKVVWRMDSRGNEVYAGSLTESGLYGQTLPGYRDASLAESRFALPWGIAPFLDGWAVSDPGNHMIRLLRRGRVETINPRVSDPAGVPDAGLLLDYPCGLAADEEGSLYVSDTFKGVIWRIRPDGTAERMAEGLSDPMGLCCFRGTLYIAETGKNRVVSLSGGRLETVAGGEEEGFQDGPADTALFSAPRAVAASPNGDLYVSDTLNSAVRRIRAGDVSTVLAREAGTMEPYLVSPCGLAVSGGTVYVCDSFTGKLFQIKA